MARRLAPEVNAGSMADIAFLLLIFFLVTTTIETDFGINRKLSALTDEPTNSLIKERNLFQVEINSLDELLVEKESMDLKSLKRVTIDFLDNGGGLGRESCDYCKGAKSTKSSDNPNKAVISLVNSREASYEMYVAVQNELVKAYTDLRNRESIRLFGISFMQMKKEFKDLNYEGDKELLKERIKKIQSMFPEKISEAEPVQASL